MRHSRLGAAAVMVAALLLCGCTSPKPDVAETSTDAVVESDAAPEVYRGPWEPALIRDPAEVTTLTAKPTRAWEVMDTALWGRAGLQILGVHERFIVTATAGPAITEFAGLRVADGSVAWRFTPDAGTTTCAVGVGEHDAVACATSVANPQSARLWTLDAYNGKIRDTLPLPGAGTVSAMGFDGKHVYAVVFDPAGKAHLVSWTLGEPGLRWQQDLAEVPPTSPGPTAAPSTSPVDQATIRSATITAAPNIVTVNLGNSSSFEVMPDSGAIVAQYPGRSATVTQTGDVRIGPGENDPGYLKRAGTQQVIVREAGAQLGYADRLAIDSASTDMQAIAVLPARNQVRLYSRADGSLIWSFERAEKYYPVAVCRQEILLAQPAGLTAIDLRTSAVLWERQDVKPADDAGFLCAANDFLALTADSITAFAFDDGSTSWQADYEPQESISWRATRGHLISTTGHSVALWR